MRAEASREGVSCPPYCAWVAERQECLARTARLGWYAALLLRRAGTKSCVVASPYLAFFACSNGMSFSALPPSTDLTMLSYILFHRPDVSPLFRFGSALILSR